jgi:DNA-binding winged helix-turn-helix (wHTH) protein/Tol biopolymer transport system component
MTRQAKNLYEFGPYQVDADDRLLLREGKVVPLPPKVFDILLVLVEESGRVLDKDELMQRVWPDTFVEEGNLARNVSTLRRLLGESDEGQQYIETIPRRGYRFVAKVKEMPDGSLLLRERASITIEHEDDNAEEVEAAGRLPAAPAVRTRLFWLALAGLALAAGLVAGYLIGNRRADPAAESLQSAGWPSYYRLSFRRGNLSRARIASDNQTVIYSALIEGRPPELFTTRLGSPDSRPLGITGADIFSISSTGQMAILLWDEARRPTLAQVPLVGGEPRKVLDNVMQADWSPDGKGLAIVHGVDGRQRIEFPIGNVIYESAGTIGGLEFSPKGDLLAFPEYQQNGPASVQVIDLAGNKRTLSEGWPRVQGLAWSASGSEIWFSAARTGFALALNAVDLAGNQRLVARIPGKLSIQDISSDGRVLMEMDVNRTSMLYLAPGAAKEQDLSWLDGSTARAISDDGKTIIFNERGEAGGESSAIYMRGADSPSAVRLGEGTAMALSPDGRYVLAYDPMASPQQLFLLPTGAGQTIRLERGDVQSFTGQATWFPDGKRVLFATRGPNRTTRLYSQDVEGGPPRPVAAEGIGFGPISPDGKLIAGRSPDRRIALYPVNGGEPLPVEGVEAGEQPIHFSPDGRYLFITRFRELPGKIYRLEIKTGRRELWKELAPPDPDWFGAIATGHMTPDGRSYVYSYNNVISTLYLVDGLK